MKKIVILKLFGGLYKLIKYLIYLNDGRSCKQFVTTKYCHLFIPVLFYFLGLNSEMEQFKALLREKNLFIWF